MINTVVRQIAFYRYETRLHDERRSGELLPERIGQIWREVQTESLGPAFNLSPDYDVFWAYVPHFVHSPFYVYAYAFGDCLVNALYGVFQAGHPGFQAKYVEMLRAGGTKRHTRAAGAVRARRLRPVVLAPRPRRAVGLHRRAGSRGTGLRARDGRGLNGWPGSATSTAAAACLAS